MKREQSRAGSRFAECEKSRLKAKILITLALLLTAVTGAWADETLLLTIESRDYTSFKSGSKTFDDKVTVTFSNSVYNDGDNWGWNAGTVNSLLTVAGINGYTITSCKFYVEINGPAMTGYTVVGESPSVYLAGGYVFTDANLSVFIGEMGITKIEVYGYADTPEPASELLELTWNETEQVWEFDMPEGNVEIEPLYYSTTGVDLAVSASGGKAQLMDGEYQPLGDAQVKEDDKFVLMVERDDDYDFRTSFSTGDDTKDFMTEFTEDEYAAFVAYAQENGISLSPTAVMMWVTMPHVETGNLTLDVAFEKEKTYTVLYKRSGSEAGVVGCKMARTVNGQEEVSYSLLQRGASMGDNAVWTMTMTSAFDPTKVAFYESAVPQGQAETEAFANALEGAAMATATISANAGTWNSVTGGGEYLIIHGNVKVVTASFVADANAVTTMKDCTFDVATTKGGVTYQLAVCKTDAEGNVTEAGTVNAPAAPTAPEGKVFAGWRGYEYDGLGRATEKTYNAGATGISVRDNVTFSAVWNPVQVTTTFAMNGGTGTSTSTTVNYGETLGDISTPTRKGFVLDRWTVAKAVTESGVVFGKGATFNMNTALTSNLSLTAQWKHVHEYTSYQISQFGDALKAYQKYNGYLHIAICGCDDVDIVEHDFNPAGKCACGYEKPSPTNVEVETFYGKKEGNTYTNYMNGMPEYPLRGSEVTIEAPHNWGDLEFKTWEYSTDGGTTWYELAAYEIVGFLAPCNMKARAIYVNPVQTPTVELTTSEYLQDTEYEGQTYKMGNILYQMNYKLPDGYKMLGGGIRMGDNSGISYYFKQTVKTSFDNESKGIIGAMGAGIAGLGMLTGGVDFMTLKDLGEGAFAEQYSTRYLETEENVMQKEKMTAATLAKKMMENTPINVEKYEPIYWDATVPTKGQFGSACTLPPLRFAQKNNQDHYIYGVAYITYLTPNNETKTLYTDAVAATVNHPDCHSVKEAEQPAGARMMTQQREATATRRAPMREPIQQPAEQVDMSSIMAPQTQLTVYVDGKYEASLSDTYGYGETISLTAPTVSGKSFSYWTADGSVVSNSTTLKMTINANTTLRAMYDAEAATATAAITSVSRTGDGTQINVQAIGSGTFDKAGVVYSTTATEPTINGDGVTNVEAVSYQNLSAQASMPASILDKNKCWSMQIKPADADAVCYVRAYTVNGGTTTYGDVKEVKLSSLKSGLMMVANLEAFETDAEPTLSDLLTQLKAEGKLLAGFAVEVPAGEYVTYYNDKALKLSEASVATAQLYTITSVGQETATATELQIAAANTPLLVKNNGEETMTIMLMPTDDTADDITAASEFIGTLEETTIAASTSELTNYAFNGLQFVWVKNAIEVGPNKCWISIPSDISNVKALTIVFGEATGLKAMDNGQLTMDNWYDLNGRKLDKMPTKKGVYIMNGKKVVVK